MEKTMTCQVSSAACTVVVIPDSDYCSRKLAIARVTLQRQGLLDASRGTKFEQYQASSSTRGHHSRILKYLMCQRMSVYRASKQCAIM